MKQTMNPTRTTEMNKHMEDDNQGQSNNSALKGYIDQSELKLSDRLCLVPKRWMYLRISFITLMILSTAALVAIVFLAKGEFNLSSIVFMIVLSVLTLLLLSVSVFMGIYQKRRLNKFNQEDHSIAFTEAYLRNQSVTEYSIVDNDAQNNRINPHLFPCSQIPGAYLNFGKKLHKIRFDDSVRALEYVISRTPRYDDGSVKKIFANNENSVTALVVRMPSLDYRTFFLAHDNFLTSTVDNRATINKQELSFVNGVKNLFYVFQNPLDLRVVSDFDKRFLKDILFSKDDKNLIRFDLYNDADASYLIAYVPSWFGRVVLESNESVLEFNEKCNKQAWYDMKILKYIDKAASGLHENLFRSSYKKKMIMIDD